MDPLRRAFDTASSKHVDLERILESIGGELHHYAQLLTGSAAGAEDALHDLLVDVLEKGSALRNVENPRGWLFTVIRRRAQRGKAWSIRRRELDIVPTVDLDPADQSVFNEAWQMLTDREKEVAVLHIWEGLTFAEIAAVLDMPRGTALSCYHRAIKRLRAVYGVPGRAERSEVGRDA